MSLATLTVALAGRGPLAVTVTPSRSRVSTVTMTDSNSNIESESVSQYAQAAQRLRGDDSCGRGLRQGRRGGGRGARRPSFGAGCLGLKIQKEGNAGIFAMSSSRRTPFVCFHLRFVHTT